MKDCAKEGRFPEADTNRQNSWINLVRGERFYINFQKLIESKQGLNNLKALNQRNCDLNIDTISYRTLHHWDSMNLIECERKTASSWRKFNLFEVLWVHVILKFREMGVSLDMVSKAKEGFFKHILLSDIKYADYYTIAALYFKAPVYFVTLPCGQSEFLEYIELTNAMAIAGMEYRF